jgi:C1A family cysteine protease
MTIRVYNGFRPEPYNPKHFGLEANLMPFCAPLPQFAGKDIDFRPFSSPCHKQAHTQSCVAQAAIKALEIKRIGNKSDWNPDRVVEFGMPFHVDLSRLALYYLAREIMIPSENHRDAGTYVSNACDALRRFGVCEEKFWPFDESKILVSPPWSVMRKAYLHKINSFYRINAVADARIDSIIVCLRAGHPVIYGTAIGEEWAKYDGSKPLTVPNTIIGKHATVLVGYQNGVFIGENSYGASWGANGFYFMDAEYLKWNVSSDFWMLVAPWEI